MWGSVPSSGFSVVSQILEENFVGRLRWNIPLSLDGGERSIRGPGVGGNNSDEIAIVDYFDAGDLFRLGGVERFEGCVESLRAQNLSEHHAGEMDVRGVLVF